MTRRLPLLALLVLVATMLVPAPAQAIAPPLWPGFQCPKADNPSYECNTVISSLDYYKGWAHTGGKVCGAVYVMMPAPYDAWRWTGSGWQHTTVPRSTAVYVWPFAVAWSWVWTAETGWVAMRDSNLVVNPWCDPYLVPTLAAGRWGG